MRFIFGAVAVAGLCACSGSGTSVAVVDLPADRTENSGTVMSFTISADGKTLTADTGSSSTDAPIDAVPNVGDFIVALDRTGSNSIIALNQTEDGFAGIGVIPEGGFETSGVTYGRIGPASAPEFGSADYSGDYLAVFIDTSTDGFYMIPDVTGRGISGDFALSLDFAGMTASGSITDRQLIDFLTGDEVAGGSVEDVTLAESMWDEDGFLSGDTSGGSASLGANTSVAANGRYQAYIVGDEASGVVGMIRIPHDFGDAVTERGAFVVNR